MCLNEHFKKLHYLLAVKLKFVKFVRDAKCERSVLN